MWSTFFELVFVYSEETYRFDLQFASRKIYEKSREFSLRWLIYLTLAVRGPVVLGTRAYLQNMSQYVTQLA